MQAPLKNKGIVAWDATFPIIIPFFILALLTYSFADGHYFGGIGEAYAHWLHLPNVHFSLMVAGLWFFFLHLGAEIEIADVIAAGPLVIAATLGGVLIPMFLTSGLLYSFGGLAITTAIFASAGAMATDVPMALGSARGVKSIVVTAMFTSLLILAVGDDLVGVIAMTSMFADGIGQIDALTYESLILLGCWAVGKRGDIAVKEMDGDKVISKKIFDITFESPAFWIVVAILNTYFLGRNGIEPILGGCLPLIFAPAAVKHLVAKKTEALALWLLLPFALVAGAVNVLEASAWGVFTLLALVGGFGGKVIGIFGGGILGRRYADPEGDYGVKKFTNTSLLGMAIAGACNGTVAIIFVSVAESKGLVPQDIAGQMKIGFLLTVPLSYIINLMIGRVLQAESIP